MTLVKFQADADLKQAIVTGVLRRQPNIDFQSANAAGLEGKQDSEVLMIAAQDSRVLVTHQAKLCLLSLAISLFQKPVLGF
jgi:predicted nuclease of predicted toxin-antitoxin system